MSWAAVREAVRVAISQALRLADVPDLLGGVTRRVDWENRNTASRMVGETFVDLRFSGPTAVSSDEIRYEYSETTDKLSAVYVGQRIFGVQVLVQSESQEPDSDAVGVMGGRLRTRLRRSEILAGLQAAQVALVRIAPTFDVSYVNQEGRAMSASSTDITFSTVECEQELGEDVSWVERVYVEGTVPTDDEACPNLAFEAP